MRRVRSLCHYADETGGEFFPHLYEKDIQQLRATVVKMGAQDDPELQDFALLLTRVLDWISAESNAIAHSIRMTAFRDAENNVVVRNLETGCEGRGEFLTAAMLACMTDIDRIETDLSEMAEEERSNLDNLVFEWLENFPYE